MARKVHYAWVVAGVTFLVLLVTAGIRATPGVLMVPLESEFGWNRALILGAVAINIALFGLIGPFAAAVMDRYGPAAGGPGGARAADGVGRADDAHAARVAVAAVVGRARRIGDRRHLDGARRRLSRRDGSTNAAA
jgi:hypothetical protein